MKAWACPPVVMDGDTSPSSHEDFSLLAVVESGPRRENFHHQPVGVSRGHRQQH